MTTSISNPTFGGTARAARGLGWTSVLLLPYGQKKSPPIGYTGAEGKLPTDEDYSAWDAQAGEHYNIAVVMPENVAGLDIDVKDGKRGDLLLAEMAARLGDLPPTYSITARGADSASRIYLYRRNRTCRLRGFLGGPADGGEIIQPTHRYIVGPGSLHPDGGIYTVYDPAGQPIEGLPAVADLAVLPEAWEDDLAAHHARATSADVEDFIDSLPDGDYDEDTQNLLDEFSHRLNDEDGWGRFADCGSSQAAMLRITMDLAIAGACGVPGVPMALASAEDIFVSYRSSRGDNLRDAEGTWRRALAGAIGYVRENGVVPLELFEVPDDLADAHRRSMAARQEAKPRKRVAAQRRRLSDRILTRGQLTNLPEPEPLIENTLDLRTVALLAGYHGTCKSFVALDWAASVATGTTWMGRPVKQGRVLYIVGEGVNGIDKRLVTWEQAHGAVIGDDALLTVNGAVQIADPSQLFELLDVVESGGFALVVVDTVARSAVGLDENSAKDMGQFIDAADTIRQVMDSGTVLLVHHTGKDKSTVRGSSALEAAMDTVYATEGDPLNLRMRRTKRKDGPIDDLHQLRLREVADSAVLESLDPSVRETVAENTRTTRGWTALVATFGDRTFTKSEAVTVLTETADIPKSTAYRVITDLAAIEAVRDISTTRTPRFVVDRGKGTKAGLPNVSGPSLSAGDGWFDGLLG